MKRGAELRKDYVGFFWSPSPQSLLYIYLYKIDTLSRKKKKIVPNRRVWKQFYVTLFFFNIGT